jgi:hypothetical protein
MQTQHGTICRIGVARNVAFAFLLLLLWSPLASARSPEAKEQFAKNLALFESIAGTELVGRQADLADQLLQDAESADDLLRIAEPLSRTSLVGRQSQVFQILIKANWDDREALLRVAEPLVNTSLVGLQGDLFDHVWNPDLSFETKMRIAVPLSMTTLVGRQGSVFDDLILKSWNDADRLALVLRVLSLTTLVGRQGKVAERLAELANRNPGDEDSN